MTSAEPPCPPDPAHLLLVDDDRLVLATLARGLQALGWQVSCADSAEDARTLLAGGLHPDLALLDMRMPGDDGLSLAAQWRDAAQGEPSLPFIMLSAFDDEATVAQAAQLGALGYLVKPLEVAQLSPMLCTALARERERRSLQASQTQLQDALDGERTIDVAVGITMMQYRLTRQAAFELLRTRARTQRRKLAAMALEVVQGCDHLHGRGA